MSETAPKEGEVWVSRDGFAARVVATWPKDIRAPFPPWPSVAYRRKTGGPLVNMRLDRFLNRFSRAASTPTGPFE